jgi:hypothetical protein
VISSFGQTFRGLRYLQRISGAISNEKRTGNPWPLVYKESGPPPHLEEYIWQPCEIWSKVVRKDHARYVVGGAEKYQEILTVLSISEAYYFLDRSQSFFLPLGGNTDGLKTDL